MGRSFRAGAVSCLDGGDADGVHLLWAPPRWAGHATGGFAIQRRASQGKPDIVCDHVTPDELAQVHAIHRVEIDAGTLSFRAAQYPTLPMRAHQRPPTGPPPCVAYTIELAGVVRDVELAIPGWPLWGAAFAGDKAIATALSTERGGEQVLRFAGGPITRVVVYAALRVEAMRICRTLEPSAEDEAAAWAGVPYLAKAIELDREGFTEVMTTAAECLRVAAAGGTSAPRTTLLTRAATDRPFVEMRPWALVLATTVLPDWRRALGFGFLDRADLAPGATYDYRISGEFRACDLDDEHHGLHGVPLGTVLPCDFHLGPFLVHTPAPATVVLVEEPDEKALRHVSRKGIAIGGESALTITFPAAVRRVVLDLAPGRGERVLVSAGRRRPIAVTASGATVVELSAAVEELTLSGDAFFCGVFRDPDAEPALVTASVVLPRVRFEPTPPPPPPLLVDTALLQATALPDQPPQDLGFRVSWLPAFAFWPPDLDGAPPQDAFGFRIERSAIDGGEKPVALDDGSLFFGGREGRREPAVLAPGVDLCAAFPDHRTPSAPAASYLDAHDVLIGGTREGPPLGGRYQYRVSTVDAIGRESAPRAGAVLRLEKHRPPPMPVDVRARILQRDDPDLAAADRPLLGAARTALVVDWDWRPEERALDPYVRELRIYLRLDPPDVIRGELVGPIARTGAHFTVAATLSQPVAAAQIAGTFIWAGEYPFCIAHNTAGTHVELALEPSRLAPARAPQHARFDYFPPLGGAAQTPPGWDRVAIRPLDDASPMRVVLPDLVHLDASHPSVRVWVAVSAADGEDYVPDALPASAPNGGRPGNESRLACAQAIARYRGRPAFAPPPRTADLPALVTDEPIAGAARIVLDLPALLPGVTVAPTDRLRIERLPLDALLRGLGTRADGRFDLALPGPAAPVAHALANADDHAALVGALAAGIAAAIPDRAVVQLVIDHEPALEPLWEIAADLAPFAPLVEHVPDQAARFLYRARLVDAARHVSVTAALLPAVVRVASLRSPAPPELVVVAPAPAGVEVRMRYREAHDLRWLVVFSLDRDATAPVLDRAQLLRQPNLRGRYPYDGLRLRLPDGNLLAPAISVDVTRPVGIAIEGEQRLERAGFAAPPDRQVAVWAIAVTRDGVPSRLAGPLVTRTP